METSTCPACHSDVIIDDEAFEGDLVDCVNCGAELEIISLKPNQLSIANQDEEYLDDQEEENSGDENDY